MEVHACSTEQRAAGSGQEARNNRLRMRRLERRCLCSFFPAFLTVSIICWLMMPAGRAEQADSGWVVGTPSTDTIGPPSRDPATQIVIDQILQQTRVPLLQTPSPTAKSVPEAIDWGRGRPGSLGRVAQTLPGIDGWRAVQESTTVSEPARGPAPTTSGTSLNAQRVPPSAQGIQEGAVDFRAPKLDTLPAIRFGGTTLPASQSSTPDEQSSGPQAVLSTIEPVPTASAGILDAAETSGLAEARGPAFVIVTDESTTEAPPQRTAEPFAPEQYDDEAPAVSAREATNPPVQALTDAQTVPSAADPAPVLTAPVGVGDDPARLPPLTRQLMNLRTKVRSVLKGYSRKSLNSRENDPWEVMHGMLAYELHSKLHQGGPRGELITSVGWLCYNKPCKNLTLLYVTPGGELRAKQGVGLQGHKGQLLAMLAQSRVSPDYPVRVGSHHFTIRDLIEAEKKTCYPKTELTFKLIAFTHYLDLNEKWVNDEGLHWDMPRLIREELAQPIRGAACGGTHRLSGLSLAVKARERRGEPLDGEYLRAAEYIEKYENYAFRLQNRNGSLSTRWFQGQGDENDDDRRLKTTGHILEWLVYSLSDEELREQRTIRAVNYLASLLYSNYKHEWEIGPRSHAIHALLRYDERVFRPYDGVENVASSKSSQPSARRPSRASRR